MVIAGAIGDYGKGTKANAAGQPDPNGTYSLAKLHHGSILLNTAPLKRAIKRGTQHARPDLASCSLQGSTSATVPIVSGTGQYAGITGNIRAEFTFAEIAGRHTNGAKKGTCNLDAGPVARPTPTRHGRKTWTTACGPPGSPPIRSTRSPRSSAT